MTKLSEAFEILEDHGMPKTEEEKVDIMLCGMRSTNMQVVAACSKIRVVPSLHESFKDATDRLMEVIGSLTERRDMSRDRRGIYSATMDRGSGNRGGRGYGRGGQGRGRGRGSHYGDHRGQGASAVQEGQRFNNGVDVSDLTRYFPVSEWFLLDRDVQQEIMLARESQRSQAGKRKVDALSSDHEQATERTAGGGQHQNDNIPSNETSSGQGNGANFGSSAYGQQS